MDGLSDFLQEEREKEHDINTLLRVELAGTRIATPRRSLVRHSMVELLVKLDQEVSLSN